MIYAQIVNGVVVNTIILNDSSLLYLFLNDPTTESPFDYVLQINNLYPRPGINWTFDGIIFSPPIDYSDDNDSGD